MESNGVYAVFIDYGTSIKLHFPKCCEYQHNIKPPLSVFMEPPTRSVTGSIQRHRLFSARKRIIIHPVAVREVKVNTVFTDLAKLLLILRPAHSVLQPFSYHTQRFISVDLPLTCLQKSFNHRKLDL
jgi:hypothetical protein